MRNLNELYTITLHRYINNEKYQRNGLCYLIARLKDDSVIDDQEYTALRNSILSNKPTRWVHKEFFKEESFRRESFRNNMYWWPMGLMEQRILFLEKMITYVQLPWYSKLWERLK